MGQVEKNEILFEQIEKLADHVGTLFEEIEKLTDQIGTLFEQLGKTGTQIGGLSEISGGQSGLITSLYGDIEAIDGKIEKLADRNQLLVQQGELNTQQIAANKTAINAILLALCDDSDVMAAKLKLYLKVAATIEKSSQQNAGMMDGEGIAEQYFDSHIASFESVLQDYKAIKKQLGR